MRIRLPWAHNWKESLFLHSMQDSRAGGKRPQGLWSCKLHPWIQIIGTLPWNEWRQPGWEADREICLGPNFKGKEVARWEFLRTNLSSPRRVWKCSLRQSQREKLISRVSQSKSPWAPGRCKMQIIQTLWDSSQQNRIKSKTTQMQNTNQQENRNKSSKDGIPDSPDLKMITRRTQKQRST